MAFGTNSKSEKIIRDDIKKRLENYLLFRHFIRHSYSSELDWNEMEPLIKGIEYIWKVIKINFEIFIKDEPPRPSGWGILRLLFERLG